MRFTGARGKGIDGMYELVRIVLSAPTILIYRARQIGVETCRHMERRSSREPFSQMDHFFAAVSCGDKCSSWPSRSYSPNPVITFIMNHGGVFPVRRGYNDEEGSRRPTRSSVAMAAC